MNDLTIFTIATGIFFTVSILFYGYKKHKLFRMRTEYIQSRQALLTSTTIEALLEAKKEQISALEKRIENGRLHMEKLESLLSDAIAKVRRINVGLSPPTFKFDDSEALKSSVLECRDKQYECIQADRATNALTNWEWFGSKSDGNKMVADYRVLLLKAFNAEFEFIRRQMRVSTFNTASDKLHRLIEQLANLGETAGVQISSEYERLKYIELQHWHVELKRKENIKIARKEQRELLREQMKLINDDSDELDEEIAVQESELSKARKKAEQLAGEERAKLERQIEKIKAEKIRLEEKFARAVSQAQITKAGYVYVISNRGSFGEGGVKIGMTRRLEPMDRVNELGDASVPFRFDVHALAFVNDAPRIEKALHNKFHDKRVNTENFRKEFFHVTPQEVKAAMEVLKIETDWYLTAEAKEFNESLLMRNAIRASKEKQQEVELPEAI